MLEFYQAYATYQDLMVLTEALFSQLAKSVLNTTTITYQGRKISFEGPWQKIPLIESLERFAGMDPSIITDHQALIDFAASKMCH